MALSLSIFSSISLIIILPSDAWLSCEMWKCPKIRSPTSWLWGKTRKLLDIVIIALFCRQKNVWQFYILLHPNDSVFPAKRILIVTCLLPLAWKSWQIPYIHYKNITTNTMWTRVKSRSHLTQCKKLIFFNFFNFN